MDYTVETIDGTIGVAGRENGELLMFQYFNNNNDGAAFTTEAEAQTYIDTYLTPPTGSPPA